MEATLAESRSIWSLPSFCPLSRELSSFLGKRSVLREREVLDREMSEEEVSIPSRRRSQLGAQPSKLQDDCG